MEAIKKTFAQCKKEGRVRTIGTKHEHEQLETDRGCSQLLSPM